MNTPVTYLALGDSLTEGVGAEQGKKGFVEGYFDHLRRTPQCKVINLGKSGMVSEELYQAIKGDAEIRTLLPEVNEITISIGGNDLLQVAENEISLLRLFQVTDRLMRNLRNILSTIKSRAPQANILLLGLYLPNTPTNKWIPLATSYLRKVNQKYRRVAQSFDTAFADPFDIFFSKPELYADEIHPNQQGYERLTEALIELRSEWIPEIAINRANNKNPLPPVKV